MIVITVQKRMYQSRGRTLLQESGLLMLFIVVTVRLFVRREILQELSTFEGIDTLHVAHVQLALELCDAFHALLGHPVGHELVVFIDDGRRLLVEHAADLYG